HVNFKQRQANNPSMITLQSNWIGIDVDGHESRGSAETIALRITASEVLFGGAAAGERNRVGAGTEFHVNNFEVRNNEFLAGAQFTGSASGEIRNNEFDEDVLQLIESYRDIRIYANRNIGSLQIDTDISVDQIAVEVGTDNTADANTFVGHGIIGMAKVRVNRFECVYYPFLTPVKDPFITVEENSDTRFSGIATPYTDIYIYDDDTGCDIASPATFVRKVTADANGTWEITGDFSTRRFTANAVRGNQSSGYTQVGFKDKYSEHRNNFILINPYCGKNNGSIEVVNYLNTLEIDWYDTKDQHIGSGDIIEDLGPGEYTCMLRNGNGTMKFNYELHEREGRFYDRDSKVGHSQFG